MLTRDLSKPTGPHQTPPTHPSPLMQGRCYSVQCEYVVSRYCSLTQKGCLQIAPARCKTVCSDLIFILLFWDEHAPLDGSTINSTRLERTSKPQHVAWGKASIQAHLPKVPLPTLLAHASCGIRVACILPALMPKRDWESHRLDSTRHAWNFLLDARNIDVQIDNDVNQATHRARHELLACSIQAMPLRYDIPVNRALQQQPIIAVERSRPPSPGLMSGVHIRRKAKRSPRKGSRFVPHSSTCVNSK